MKYIKKYEELKPEPEKGDYVAVRLIDNPAAIARELEKHIGRIESKTLPNVANRYDVKFGTTNWWIDRKDIIDWSKNKEDLIHYIPANKFNL